MIRPHRNLCHASGTLASLSIQPHIAPIFLRWPPALFVLRVCTTRRDRPRFWRRCQVFIQCLRLWRWSAPVTAGDDPHHFGFARLNERQHIARPNRPRRFADRLAIDTYFSRTDDARSKAARFEEPRMPQPFVQTDCRPVLGQSFLNPAKAAANGLSGSIAFSFLGRAW